MTKILVSAEGPGFVDRRRPWTRYERNERTGMPATEATNRAAGVSWLESGAGANTRTATDNVRVAAIATARSTQYGPIRRTASANYVTDNETDGVKCPLRTLKGSP